MRRYSIQFAAVLPMLLEVFAFGADIDTVHRKSDGRAIAGEIASVSRTEVVVTQKIGNKEFRIPANDIRAVEWKGEPAELGLARGNERAGSLPEALAGLQESRQAAQGADLLAEIDFLIARTGAKLALANPMKLTATVDQLKSFVERHRDHFRFYDAQLLLGEAALAAGDSSVAESAYTSLELAPWQDFQMAAQIGRARVLLGQDDFSGAETLFNQVAEMSVQTPAEQARRLEALLGQTECMQHRQQFSEAAGILQNVIDQTDAGNARLLAEAYVRLGDCHAAEGQEMKRAVLAYLHVDVIPSLAAQTDLHAEALYQLARLWPVIGHPARGAEASAKLEEEYPNSQWTRKLGSGS